MTPTHKETQVSALHSPLPRIAFGGILAVLLAIAVWLLGGVSADRAGAQVDRCANAPIRSLQNSTHLPDCRAYEQVSPADKNGNHVGVTYPGELTPGAIFSGPDGDRVAFASPGSFAGDPGALGVSSYFADRGTDGWHTNALSPPAEIISVSNARGVIATTRDFSVQLVVTHVRLAPGAVPNNWNLYIHDLKSGIYAFVATWPTAGSSPGIWLAGLSENGGHWYFTVTSDDLDSTPAPPSTSSGGATVLYFWDEDAGQLRLASILPNGDSSIGRAGQSNGAKSAFARRPVSSDGSQVYWSIPSGGGIDPTAMYLYRNGASVAVTERETDGTQQQGIFQYATVDGSQAFLTSDDQLTADANPAGFDLYRYDRDAGDLVDLTPDGTTLATTDAGVEAVLATSENGSYVYFVATGELAPGAVSGQKNIYVWHDEQIRLVSTSENGFPAVGKNKADVWWSRIGSWRVSPNGRYLGFVIDGALTGSNPQPDVGSAQAYLYDYDDDSLTCVSCPSAGQLPSGDAGLGTRDMGNSAGGAFTAYREVPARNLLDDGRFFFQSPDGLAAGDSNGKQDVYLYDHGRRSLISGGRGGSGSYFGNASPDGADAFFVTLNRLVGQDGDLLYDLYDARVGGGIASQNPPPAPPPCEGDACQGAAAAPPPAREPGSAAFTGPRNEAADEGQGASQRCTRLERRTGKARHRARRAKRALRRMNRRAGRAGGKRAKRLERRSRRMKKQLKELRREARKSTREARRCTRGDK